MASTPRLRINQSVSASWRTGVQKIQNFFLQLSFITLHYLYFLITCFITSIILWATSTPAKGVRYIDTLFLAVSAMTEAGLNTVNLSQLNTGQQIILLLLIIIGSAIFVSCAILHIRKREFEIRLQELTERRRKRISRPRSLMDTIKSMSHDQPVMQEDREAAIISGAIRGRIIHEGNPDLPYIPTRSAKDDPPEDCAPEISREGTMEEAAIDQNTAAKILQPTNPAHVTFATSLSISSKTHTPKLRNRAFYNTGVGVHSAASHPRNTLPFGHAISTMSHSQYSGQRSKLSKYVKTINGYIGRNSQFHQLTEEERRELGGLEYDAICLLSWVVPLYLVLFQLLGSLGCGAWMWMNRPATASENGVNPFWAGIFFAVSAFNNSGMALLDANATVLQTSYYMLLTLSLLILAGNTCFPIFLRLIFWTLKHSIPNKTQSISWANKRLVLEFILDHPRRVYTHLFPSEATWWLATSLIVLNGVDWLAFEVLNIGNPIMDAISLRFRVLDGLFQALAVRCGGFYVVNIARLYPGTLVLYTLMMYLSAYPVTMSIRNTNVYEERSLGIFADDPPTSNPVERQLSLHRAQSTLNLVRRWTQFRKDGNESPLSMDAKSERESASPAQWKSTDFLRLQVRGQLSHDLWWLAIAVFLITVIETHSLLRNPVDFSIFNILFEVISAYGTVGISVGIPWNSYSFSGTWHTGSKLILCAVMLRGRHRGLPVTIDRAILLPNETLAWAEEEDGLLKRTRTGQQNLYDNHAPSSLMSPRIPPRVFANED